jgi:hypothetical protein
MFDGLSVILTPRGSDAPALAAGALPWRLVVLLICCATLSAVLAILYPNVFATPLEQF